MSLTNEQLALIDTLMYCEGFLSIGIDNSLDDDNSTLNNALIQMFYTNEKGKVVEEFNSSCDNLGNTEELKKVVDAILADPELCNLKVVATSETYANDYNLNDTSGVRAICLVDESEERNNLTVIYAGDYYSLPVDGNQQGWYNVFMGAMEDDTDGQQFALDFLMDSYTKYGSSDSEVTVSGHSAGGNYSQYVTILSDVVDNCFSFDGQGFSKGFLVEYESEIKEKASKITCINPNTSYVGSLMNPIPGTKKIFIDVGKPECGVIGYHMPIELLNDEGYFKSKCEPSQLYELLNGLSIGIVDAIESDLFFDEEGFMELIGNVFSCVMNEETEKIKECLSTEEAIQVIGVLASKSLTGLSCMVYGGMAFGPVGAVVGGICGWAVGDIIPNLILNFDGFQNGFEKLGAALQIRKYNKDVYIVFLTSHTEFMQDAFKVRAYRFLVKPIDENDFFESVIQAENEMMNTEKISITVNDKTSLVSLDDIIYIEAFGDGAFIYTNNEVYESNKTLKYWTEQLGKIHFFRVHKSYLVSFKYINSIEGTGVLMRGISQSIPISRRNHSNFKRAFVEYVTKYAKYV